MGGWVEEGRERERLRERVFHLFTHPPTHPPTLPQGRKDASKDDPDSFNNLPDAKQGGWVGRWVDRGREGGSNELLYVGVGWVGVLIYLPVNSSSTHPPTYPGDSHLRDIFYRMGFVDRELVALSGGRSPTHPPTQPPTHPPTHVLPPIYTYPAKHTACSPNHPPTHPPHSPHSRPRPLQRQRLRGKRPTHPPSHPPTYPPFPINQQRIPTTAFPPYPPITHLPTHP